MIDNAATFIGKIVGLSSSEDADGKTTHEIHISVANDSGADIIALKAWANEGERDQWSELVKGEVYLIIAEARGTDEGGSVILEAVNVVPIPRIFWNAEGGQLTKEERHNEIERLTKQFRQFLKQVVFK